VDKLGNILATVLRRQPGGARILGSQVAAAFKVVIGPEPARLCDEVELRSGVLVVTPPAQRWPTSCDSTQRRWSNVSMG